MRARLRAALWRRLGYDIVPPTLRSTQDEWYAYLAAWDIALGHRPNADNGSNRPRRMRTMNTYRVTCQEIGGWRYDLGTVEAESVSDALDIAEETIITTEYRVNVAGDHWTWNGADYVASSDVAERDGFGYVDFVEIVEGEDDLGEADYCWAVTLVR